jgi:hypothetical protein
MHDYAEGFPRFLRVTGQCVASDYLADVAELESARTRAYHAADAKPRSGGALATLAQQDLPHLRVQLHPSITLMSSRFPVVSIWEANRSDNDNAVSRWMPECVLVARPHLQVEVRVLSAGAYAFISALAEGHTIGSAAERGAANVAHFDLRECFEVLIASQIVVELMLPESRRLPISDCQG